MKEIKFYLTVSKDLDSLETKTILSGWFFLNKKDMLRALCSDYIIIKGLKYKVPEKDLLYCVSNKQFGKTYLELEQIK